MRRAHISTLRMKIQPLLSAPLYCAMALSFGMPTAQGQTLERCILLANCAGALASTMPGPASCPTREDIEAAAEALAADTAAE